MRYRVTGDDGASVEVEAFDWMMAMVHAIEVLDLEVSGWVCETRLDGSTQVIDPETGRSWVVEMAGESSNEPSDISGPTVSPNRAAAADLAVGTGRAADTERAAMAERAATVERAATAERAASSAERTATAERATAERAVSTAERAATAERTATAERAASSAERTATGELATAERTATGERATAERAVSTAERTATGERATAERTATAERAASTQPAAPSDAPAPLNPKPSAGLRPAGPPRGHAPERPERRPAARRLRRRPPAEPESFPTGRMQVRARSGGPTPSASSSDTPGPPDNLAEVLFERSFDLTSADSPEQACQLALELVLDLVDCEAGSVLRGALNDDHLTFVAVTGPAADQLRGRTLPFGQGIVGASFDLGIAIQVENAQDDPRHVATFDEQTGFRTRSVLCVPVQGEEHYHGAIQLLNPSTGRFATWHREVVEQVAASLASTLEGVG